MELAKYLAVAPMGGMAGYVLVTRAGDRAVVGTILGALGLVVALTIFALLVKSMRGGSEAVRFFQRGVLFWSAAALVAWLAGQGVAKERWALTLLGIALGSVDAVAVLRVLDREKPRAA